MLPTGAFAAQWNVIEVKWRWNEPCVRVAFGQSEMVTGGRREYEEPSESTPCTFCAQLHHPAFDEETWNVEENGKKIWWSIPSRLKPCRVSARMLTRAARALFIATLNHSRPPSPLISLSPSLIFSPVPRFMFIYLRPFDSLQCNLIRIHHTI